MAWKLRFDEKALKKSKKLDANVRKKIRAYLEDRVAIHENPRDLGAAVSGTLAGFWRYRVGDYRIICKIEDETITILVIEIGHRREIYR